MDNSNKNLSPDVGSILEVGFEEYVEKFGIEAYQLKEVEKAMNCKKSPSCFIHYCENCDEFEVQKLGCNSRICTNCGKRHNDQWSVSLSKAMFPVSHRHIVLSVPIKLWPFLENWSNRKRYMDAAIGALNEVFSKKIRMKVKVGAIVILHPFGKDMGQQPHLHLLITEGGFDKNHNFVKCNFILADVFRKKWQYYVLRIFQANGLNNSLAKELYRKYPNGFYVWLHSRGRITKPKLIAKYIGRYVRHPAISNSRIYYFDGKIVKFYYDDHDKKRHYVKMDILNFIGALVQHIPPTQFKMIRYYGAYARRSTKLFKISLSKSSIAQKTLGDYELTISKINGRVCNKCEMPLTLIGFYPKGPPDWINNQATLKRWLVDNSLVSVEQGSIMSR